MANPARPAGAALITGASSGIGLELARICASERRDLVLTSRREDVLRARAKEWTREYGVTCHVIPADLSVAGSAAEVFRETARRNVAIELLINNAGYGLMGPFRKTDLARETGMIQLNVTSLVELTKYFLPDMVARRSGRILNLASTAAFQPGPLMAVYYASKAFVLSFSEALATELAGTGVTVTALCPGPTRSGFQEVAGIEGNRLLRGRMIPEAADVARFGFSAMMKGRRVAIPGALNRFMAQSVRFVPRKTIAAIVQRFHMQ